MHRQAPFGHYLIYNTHLWGRLYTAINLIFIPRKTLSSHQRRRKTVIIPQLSLQATTAGWNIQHLSYPKLLSCIKTREHSSQLRSSLVHTNIEGLVGRFLSNIFILNVLHKNKLTLRSHQEIFYFLTSDFFIFKTIENSLYNFQF